VPHDFGAHFIHPAFDHHFSRDFVQLVLSLQVGFNLLRGDAWLLLHFVLNYFFDAHLGVVGEVVPLVAVDVRVFVKLLVLAVVQLDHDFTGAEYFAFAVDVEPVFDHALEHGLDPVFLCIFGGLLEDAGEVVVLGFDHVVHLVVELHPRAGLHFVFVLVELLVLLGVQHAQQVFGHVRLHKTRLLDRILKFVVQLILVLFVARLMQEFVQQLSLPEGPTVLLYDFFNLFLQVDIDFVLVFLVFFDLHVLTFGKFGDSHKQESRFLQFDFTDFESVHGVDDSGGEFRGVVFFEGE